MKILTQEHLEERIGSCFATYGRAVDSIAAHVRRTEVIPFCDKHGVQFRAGMGTWIILDPGSAVAVENLSGWEGLQELLDTPVDGMDQNLGSLMKDYITRG